MGPKYPIPPGNRKIEIAQFLSELVRLRGFELLRSRSRKFAVLNLGSTFDFFCSDHYGIAFQQSSGNEGANDVGLPLSRT